MSTTETQGWDRDPARTSPVDATPDVGRHREARVSELKYRLELIEDRVSDEHSVGGASRNPGSGTRRCDLPGRERDIVRELAELSGAWAGEVRAARTAEV